MFSLAFLLFMTLAIVYGIYTRHRIRSRRLRLLQARLEKYDPHIETDVDRFNTKDSRSSSFKVEQGRFYFSTDIQSIRVANETLVMGISSELNARQFRFDVVIQPFEKVLMEMEGYHHFNQAGVLILGSHGAATRVLFEEIPEMQIIAHDIPTSHRAIYLHLNAFKVDKSENSVLVFGRFPDDNEFSVRLDYSNFRLTMEAPVISVTRAGNFRSFDELRQSDERAD